MKIESVEGFVLSTINYGESSKILHILTKKLGLISVISKGSLKEKSKLRTVSSVLTYGVFHIYYKKDKLSTLISADVKNYLLNIKSDIEKLGYATYLTDLTKNVYKSSESDSIYDIFISSILKIEEGFNPIIITNIVEIKYLSFLGVGLYLDGCVVCNIPNVVSISHEKGGYVCFRHRTNEPLYDEAVLKMLKAYYYVDINKITKLDIKPNVVEKINSFLDIYYKEYTGLFLKSKNFINNIKSS